MKLVGRLAATLMIALLASTGHAQVKDAILRDEPIILCGSGLGDGDCKLAQGIMRLALSRLSSSIPDWRLVVVPRALWNEVADGFHISRTTPAFTSLGIHTTYVESSLVFQDGRIDENLQRYTSLGGISKLTWVIAHEYGHILCRTADEHTASEAAGRLIYSRGAACHLQAPAAGHHPGG
jgi:hypothetical protein